MAETLITNPFTSAYASLFEALNSTPVTDLLLEDNLVRLDTKQEPQIDGRITGDLPSLRLNVVANNGGNWHSSNCLSEFPMLFELELKTATEKLSAEGGLFDVKWRVLKALYQAGGTLGNGYIERWEITDWTPIDPVEASLTDEQGWQGTATIALILNIPHTELNA